EAPFRGDLRDVHAAAVEFERAAGGRGDGAAVAPADRCFGRCSSGARGRAAVARCGCARHREEGFAVALVLHVADAADGEELGARARAAPRHLAQGRVAEDGEWGHVRFFGETAAHGAEFLEERFVFALEHFAARGRRHAGAAVAARALVAFVAEVVEDARAEAGHRFGVALHRVEFLDRVFAVRFEPGG